MHRTAPIAAPDLFRRRRASKISNRARSFRPKSAPIRIACVVVAFSNLVIGCTSSAHHTDTSSSATGAPTPSPSASTPTHPSSTTPTARPTSAHTTAQASAPCLTATQAFVLATRHVREKVGLDPTHAYDCAGGWAYVNFHVLPHGNHATIALQRVNGVWVVGDREIGCTNAPGSMPARIREYGCGN